MTRKRCECTPLGNPLELTAHYAAFLTSRRLEDGGNPATAHPNRNILKKRPSIPVNPNPFPTPARFLL